MICEVVKCDKCACRQEKDAPLAPDERRIREYSVDCHYRHLCGPCWDAEQALLAQSVWADAFGLTADADPFDRVKRQMEEARKRENEQHAERMDEIEAIRRSGQQQRGQRPGPDSQPVRMMSQFRG